MSREANAKLLRNLNIVVEAGRPDGVTRVNQAQLNEVLQGYGLPTIQIVDDRKVTVKDIYTGEQGNKRTADANRRRSRSRQA